LSSDDLLKAIKRMSEYLDEESIAAALRIPVETVHDTIAGNIVIEETETEKETIIQIANPAVYRQRIISVWRGRGGVGCTSVALHLAYLLEQMMSVLLVDLNTACAGSDVSFYLRQPEYPNMEALTHDGQLTQAVIQAEAALWVLLPPETGRIDKAKISLLMTEARQGFDAVIFDLPNADDEGILEAVACSNALVMVTTGCAQEMNRVLARSNKSQKETVLVANGYACDAKTRKAYPKVVEIPADKDSHARMEKGVFYKKGTPLSVGAEKIRNALFGMQPREKRGFVGRLRGAGGQR
jgi:MinD-like ATPase involved in chromosome partitioning or flagellar assembly